MNIRSPAAVIRYRLKPVRFDTSSTYRQYAYQTKTDFIAHMVGMTKKSTNAIRPPRISAAFQPLVIPRPPAIPLPRRIASSPPACPGIAPRLGVARELPDAV